LPDIATVTPSPRAAQLLGAQVAVLERDPLLDRIDVAAHHHALEHEPLVIGGQRIRARPIRRRAQTASSRRERGRRELGT
jgi:hypothetical protein